MLALSDGLAYHRGMKHPVVAWVSRFGSRLRFPWLVALTAGLLFLDLLVPDFIPFVDEILLALATMVLAGFRRKPVSQDPEADENRGGATIDMGVAREVREEARDS